MNYLDDKILDDYLKPLTAEQVDAIRRLRALIRELNPSLHESVDTGKWFGGLLVYNTPDDVFVYALGPRKNGLTTLHMMPYYASIELQKKHGPALKKILSGKSCIKFKSYSEVPEEAIRGIFKTAPAVMANLKVMLAGRKK